MFQSFALYIIIGIIMGLFFTFLLKKQFLGEVYGAMIIGVIGAVLGGSLLHQPVDFFYNFLSEQFKVNIFATLIGSFIFVWVFSLVSPGIPKK